MSATANPSMERVQALWRRKVALVGAGLAGLLVGVVLSAVVFAKADGSLDGMVPAGLREALADFVRSRVSTQVADLAEAVERGARVLAMGIGSALVFLVSILLIWMGSAPAAAGLAGSAGEDSGFGRFCRRASHSSPGGAIIHLFSGVAVAAATVISVPKLLSSFEMLACGPLLFGVALFLVALGIATLVPLPRVIEDPADAEPPAEPAGPVVPPIAPADELLARLRRSNIYRQQVVLDRALDGVEPLLDPAGDALAGLVRRWPRLDRVLRASGIESLTATQADAVRGLLTADSHRGGARARDVVLMGESGSGRTTVACLVALGAVLHREGALFCVTSESPEAGKDIDPRMANARAASRHPRVAIDRLLRAAGLSEQVRERSFFETNASTVVDLDGVDVLYSDTAMLGRAVLAHAAGSAVSFLRKIRFVVVDHPERLPRHDLLKLRVALARLRITAAALGARPTVVLILPPLQNQDAFAKYLLGEAHVETTEFLPWYGRCTLIGWMAPMELEDRAAERPTFVRTGYLDEVIALLTEVGRHWSALDRGVEQRPPRLAVVDGLPLLGPEARRQLRTSILGALARSGAGNAPDLAWDFLATSHVTIDRSAQWDVILLLGAGPIPDATLMPLRAALVDGGALVVLATPGPSDLETLRRMQQGRWPRRVSDGRQGPSMLRPTAPRDLVRHELGRFFGDFGARPIHRERLLAAFPPEGSGAILDAWLLEGRIGVEEYFEPAGGGSVEVQPAYVRRDPTLNGDAWPMAGKCTTTEALAVFDRDAGGPAASSLVVASMVDSVRLFIDLHPDAVLRHAPNSVRVHHVERFAAPDARTGATGRLVVVSQPNAQDLEVERRTARIDAELLADDVDRSALVGTGGLDPWSGLLTADPWAGPGARPAAEVARTWRVTLAVPAGVAPSVSLHLGRWPVELAETIRDVVTTTGRLVEDDGFTRHRELPGIEMPRRLMAGTPAVHVALLGDPAIPGDPGLVHASVNGFARLLAAWLRGEYLHLDESIRVSVVGGGDPVRARVVLYALWPDDAGSLDTLVSDVFEVPGAVQRILEWMLERLATCTCDDGCAACCGGLGTVSAAGRSTTPPGLFRDADVISRRGALALVCGLLGRDPARAEEELRRTPTRLAPDDPRAASTDRLERLRTTILGREENDYGDGIWSELFGPHMGLRGEWLASAHWAAVGDLPTNVAGRYSSGPNHVVVLPLETDAQVSEVLVHEYAHNWQFQSGQVNLGLHVESPEALRYYEGRLVLEGHATWADHQYLQHMRIGGTLRPDDGRPWDEYKTGYLLMETIERAVGRRGLFAWLAGQAEDGDGPIESRTPELPWPFTVTKALDAAHLTEMAVSGRYSSPDYDAGS